MIETYVVIEGPYIFDIDCLARISRLYRSSVRSDRIELKQTSRVRVMRNMYIYFSRFQQQYARHLYLGPTGATAARIVLSHDFSLVSPRHKRRSTSMLDRRRGWRPHRSPPVAAHIRWQPPNLAASGLPRCAPRGLRCPAGAPPHFPSCIAGKSPTHDAACLYHVTTSIFACTHREYTPTNHIHPGVRGACRSAEDANRRRHTTPSAQKTSTRPNTSLQTPIDPGRLSHGSRRHIPPQDVLTHVLG